MVEFLKDLYFFLNRCKKVVLVSAGAADLQRRLKITIPDRHGSHYPRHASTTLRIDFDYLEVPDGPAVLDV